MSPLDINFSDSKLRYWQRLPHQSYATALLLVVAGLACAGGLAIFAWIQLQDLNALQQQKQNLRDRLAAQQPAALPAAPPLSLARVAAMNAAVEKLNIPWRDLFDSIEQATPKDIALISIAPNSARQTLVLIGEAAHPDTMLDYLGALKAQPLFGDVTLTRHEINKADPNAPYRFQLEIQWRAP